MKKILSLLLLCVLVLSLAGCGSEAPKEIDGQALAGELMDAAVFSVPLDELKASKAGVFYSVDGAKLADAVMYHGSGTSKEQVVIFKAVDEKSAAEMQETLKGLVAEWIEADRNYAPAEAAKLEKAVLRQGGVYVVLVVAADADKAAEIVGKQF